MNTPLNDVRVEGRQQALLLMVVRMGLGVLALGGTVLALEVPRALVGAIPLGASLLAALATLGVAPAAEWPALTVSARGVHVAGTTIRVPWHQVEAVEHRPGVEPFFQPRLTVQFRWARGSLDIALVPPWSLATALPSGDARAALLAAAGADVEPAAREPSGGEALARLELVALRARVAWALQVGAAAAGPLVLAVLLSRSVLAGVAVAGMFIASLLVLQARTAVQVGDRWVGPGASEGPVPRDGRELPRLSRLVRAFLAAPARLVWLRPPGRRAGAPYQSADPEVLPGWSPRLLLWTDLPATSPPSEARP